MVFVDPVIEKEVDVWLKWDKNENTRNEIEMLFKSKKYDQLGKILLNRMEFGTAGLRAKMGAGNSCMNDLTIIQTTQGFAEYLKTKFGEELKSHGVVVGFDSRHNSERFSKLIANVFILNGVKVFRYSNIVPTPFVPYATVKYKACAGVMVTASHNPKQDNGYKVYWNNGAQIIPPHDSGIAAEIVKNLTPSGDDVWSQELCSQSKLVYDPYDEVMDSYYSDLNSYCLHRSTNETTDLRFTYTPVHGVGLEFARRSFQTFSLPPFEAVPEQMDPDPEFSTVVYPNPEEGKGVLKLAMETAEKKCCSVILANDPDADRLAVAEKQSDGTWKVFTGNELGALFGWWAWQCWKKTHPNADPSKVYMLSSTVSSMILQSIARVEGFNFEDTLTGFKWMGNRSDQLMKEGKTVLFAFEEAIGFMFGTNVLDKDGISAMSVIAECACHLAVTGSTLTQQLEQIYNTYGQSVCRNSYYLCHEAKKIKAMFSRLRNFDENKGGFPAIYDHPKAHRYPSDAGGFPVLAIRDLTTGFDSRTPDRKATLPKQGSSQMMTFYFANDVVLTIRTSGTEPKIKYYSEMRREGSVDALRKELDELVDAMVEQFYQPHVHGFVPRPESS